MHAERRIGKTVIKEIFKLKVQEKHKMFFNKNSKPLLVSPYIL